MRHVRPALVFFTYAMEGEYAASAVHPIWQQVQARIHGSVARMLYVSAAHMYEQGWMLSKLALKEPDFYLEILKIAYCHFGIIGCVGGRYGHALRTLPEYWPLTYCVLIYFKL